MGCEYHARRGPLLREVDGDILVTGFVSFGLGFV